MTTTHYRSGNAYLGGFGDGALPDDPNAVECPAPSAHDEVWNGSAWVKDAAVEAAKETAAKDRLIARIAALPREDQLPILWHWRAEKAANPALTRAQFLQSLRDDLDQLAALFG